MVVGGPGEDPDDITRGEPVQGGDIPDVIHNPPPQLERPPGSRGHKCQCRNCGAVVAGEFNVPCHTRRCPKCGAPMEEVP